MSTLTIAAGHPVMRTMAECIQAARAKGASEISFHMNENTSGVNIYVGSSGSRDVALHSPHMWSTWALALRMLDYCAQQAYCHSSLVFGLHSETLYKQISMQHPLVTDKSVFVQLLRQVDQALCMLTESAQA